MLTLLCRMSVSDFGGGLVLGEDRPGDRTRPHLAAGQENIARGGAPACHPALRGESRRT